MLTIAKTRNFNFPGLRMGRLTALDLFQNIPQVALSEIEKYMVEKSYERLESIFLENDPAESIWFVGKGLVKEIYHTPDGEDQTVSMVGPNGMFGSSSFEGASYGFHAVAETGVNAVALPIRDFQATMGKYAAVSKAVLAKFSALLRKAKDLHAFSQERVEKRLLHVILSLAEECGGTIPLIRKELAAMAGTSTETCIRIILRLEAAGLVSADRGKLTVKNSEKMKSRMDRL